MGSNQSSPIAIESPSQVAPPHSSDGYLDPLIENSVTIQSIPVAGGEEMRTTVDSILSTSDSSSSSSTVSSHQPRTMAIRTALKQDILGTSWSGGVGISNAGGESGTPTNGSVSNSATGAIVSLTSSLQDANTSSDNLSSIASSDLKEFPLADVKDILDDPVASTPIIALAAEVSHINEDENNITASIQSFSNCNDIIKPVAGQFSVLPAHVCLFLLKNFITHLPTAYSLSKTCKFWYTLFIDDSIFRQAAATRFHLDTAELQIRLLHESLETSWRDVYQRLDEGRTSWKGFAIDRATNNFLPYPMEIIIGKTKRVLDKRNKQQHILKTDFDGMCRWESLRNSLTKLKGSIFDPVFPVDSRFNNDSFLGTSPPRTCTFTETSIIRGDDIAIPNNYFGMMVGPVWIGMYDPGHTNFLGCFVLIMEEALASKSMVGYVEKSIWARKQKLAGNNSGATQASPMSNRQVLQDIVSSSQHSNLLLSLNEHSQNPHARLHIPTDKSERSRRLLEQAQLYEKNKKRFLNQGRTYRGILTHAVEGDKKGYHVQWKISTITSTHVSGVFSIMLVSCKNGDAATLKTFPCKLNLSMKISEIVNLDEFSDIRTVLKSLNQQSFLDEVLLVAPSVSDGIAAVNPAAEEDVQAVVSNATQTPTVASSEELFSHFENSQFSRIVKSTTSASDDEQLATSSSPSTNTNSINNDVTATSTTIDSEDEAIETQWLSEHIPLDSQISLVRLGSVLAGFFNAPKVGVFYLSIQ